MSSRLAFQTQLASIMEVLANAAVAEICKLVDDDYAVVSLQMSQCQRENKALKRKLHLLELKMARGTAERRLRESAINSSRLRVQICGSDRLRETSPSADGAFDQQTVSMWPDRALTASVPGQTECPQSKSPDVQLVEPEPVIVKEETKPETKEEVHVIEDNGIMECLPHVPERQQLSLEISPSASSQVQTCAKTRTRTSPGPQRRTSAANRGVEEREEPDVVLVKVEEPEDVKLKPNQTSLIIQEVDSCQHRPSLEEQTGAMTQRLQQRCLVESSTDDFRAELPFADAPQTSTNQLQESGQGLSESESSVVLLKIPVSTSTQAAVDSEFSLFELEPFFTRWAPDGGSTVAPSGSFSAANASEEREKDAVIILDNEPETEQELHEERFTTRAYSRAQASASQAPPSTSSPSPSIRIQSVHSQWTGTPALLRQHNRTTQQAHTNLSLTPSSTLQISASSTVPPNHNQLDLDVSQKYKKAKRYACKMCGKAFPGWSNLEAHQRVHTGERPFRCDTCGRSFSEAGNLKKHQRVHTGEKPFSCEKCGKRFAWICNLKSHQQSASCCGPPGGGGAGHE